MDGNFIFAALKYKIDIRDRLSKLFQGDEVKIYVLLSTLAELQSVGPKAQSAIDFAKACCETINDNHITGEASSDKLIKLIGTFWHYGRKPLLIDVCRQSSFFQWT